MSDPMVWHPVGLLQPQHNGRVLVAVRGTDTVDIAFAGTVRNLWETREKGEDCAYSHWMPLPTAPSASDREPGNE